MLSREEPKTAIIKKGEKKWKDIDKKLARKRRLEARKKRLRLAGSHISLTLVVYLLLSYTVIKHFSPDSLVPFYSRSYFDYNLQEANGVEYCTRRDVMQKNIGCRSLYWDEKGYSGKRNLVGRGRRKLEQNSSSVL